MMKLFLVRYHLFSGRLHLQTTLKYVVLILRADNNGEGGIFALYALVRRHAKWLVVPAIIGGSALLADGIITPPISVSSAIEGLQLVYPEIQTIPIIISIITILFLVQAFGTNIVGKAFGPIMFVWFSMLAILGILQIVKNPVILSAINPYHAYRAAIFSPRWFLAIGCGIFVYYWSRSSLLRFRALRAWGTLELAGFM